MTGFFDAIKLLYEIVMGIKALAAFIEANKREQWFQDSSKLFGRFKDAKTPEDHRALVRDLGRLWSGL